MDSVYSRKHLQIRINCTEKQFVIQYFILIVRNSRLIFVKSKSIGIQINNIATHFHTLWSPLWNTINLEKEYNDLIRSQLNKLTSWFTPKLFISYEPYELSDKHSLLQHQQLIAIIFKGSGGPMVKVSASKPRDRGLEPYTGHDHDFSYNTSTGWFLEADSRVF